MLSPFLWWNKAFQKQLPFGLFQRSMCQMFKERDIEISVVPWPEPLTSLFESVADSFTHGVENISTQFKLSTTFIWSYWPEHGRTDGRTVVFPRRKSCNKRSRVFKCSLVYVKKGFYRAANAIFGKVGRIASEEVILQLISKCIHVLLYGLEACPLVKSELSSLDFVINRFFYENV